MFLLAEVELLHIGCVQVLLKCSFCICENVGLEIVSNASISEGSAGGDGTMWRVGSLQSANLWLSVISVVLILYRWCVSDVMV